MSAIRNIPALVCCHANCGVYHFPANPRSIHAELEDIPVMRYTNKQTQHANTTHTHTLINSMGSFDFSRHNIHNKV